MRRSTVSLAAATAALLAPAGAQAAVISPQSGAPLAARGGTLVFNTADAAGYHLAVHDQAGTRPLAVAPSPLPFDLGLGADARGRATAVYSRCRAGGGWRHEVVAGSCDLYALDLASGRERRLREADRAHVSEVAPALDRGMLVFGREAALRGRSHVRTRVVVRRLGSGRERTLFTLPGTDNDLEASAIAGRRVAVAAFEPAQNATTIRLAEPGRRARLLARGGWGEESQRIFASPSFAGRHLYFTFSDVNTDFYAPNGWVLRRDLRSGRTLAAAAPGYLEGVAADPLRPGAPLVVSSYADGDPARGTDAVQTFDAPAWRTPPKLIHLR